MTRREAREQAFVLLFEKSFNNEMSFDEIIENAQMADEFEADEFAVMLAAGVDERRDELNDSIAANLKGWTISRVSRVTLILMQMALYQMKYCDDIPVSVAINESVEMAKKFATEDDASYLNGVLGGIDRAGAN